MWEVNPDDFLCSLLLDQVLWCPIFSCLSHFIGFKRLYLQIFFLFCILFESVRTRWCQKWGRVGLKDHSQWLKGSVTSCSSSDIAARWSGLLSLPALLVSALISLSSSSRRCSTRDDTCRQRRGGGGGGGRAGRLWSCKTSLLQQWQQDVRNETPGNLKFRW